MPASFSNSVLRSDDFADSFGTNINVRSTTPVGQYLTKSIELFNDMKIRNIRVPIECEATTVIDTNLADGDTSSPRIQSLRRIANEVTTTNIKYLFLTSFQTNQTLFSTNAQLVETAYNKLEAHADYIGRDHIWGYEAVNEGNNKTVGGGDIKVSAPYIVNQCRDLWQAVRVDYPSLSKYKLVGPCVANPADADSRHLFRYAPNLEQYFDYGNVHDYGDYFHPETTGWGGNGYGSLEWQFRAVAKVYAPNRQPISTEFAWVTDYLDAGSNQQYPPPSVVGSYTIRRFCMDFQVGMVKNYLYTFMEGPNPLTNKEDNYGFVVNGGNTVKPAYTYVKNFISIFTDTSPLATTFTPSPAFSCTLYGDTTGVWKPLVLEKANGDLFFVFWIGLQNWDKDAKTTTFYSRPVELDITSHKWQDATIYKFNNDGTYTTPTVATSNGRILFDIASEPTIIKVSRQSAPVYLAAPTVTTTPNVQFPLSVAVVNVKTDVTPGAIGDGSADDTTAIQTAINSASGLGIPVYFPPGTYKVTDTVLAKSTTGRLQLLGAGKNVTKIKLANAQTGFTTPKAVISFWEGTPAPTGTSVKNSIRHLTIDVGDNNPGAIGLRFYGNKVSSVEDVNIITSSASKAGKYGIALDLVANGPLLIKNCYVDGFEWGIQAPKRTNCRAYSLSNTLLQNQTVGGVYTHCNVFSIDNLTSKQSRRAIGLYNDRTTGDTDAGLVTVVNSQFTGGNRTGTSTYADAAIYTRGPLHCRRSRVVSGYGALVKEEIKDGVIRYNNDSRIHLSPVSSVIRGTSADLGYGSKADLLPLSIQANWELTSDWAVVSTPTGAAIQTAIDSGAKVICLSAPTYQISAPIIVRGNVQRIVGVGSSKLAVIAPLSTAVSTLFDIGATTSPYVIFEDLELSGSQGSNAFVTRSQNKQVILRNLFDFSYLAANNVADADPLNGPVAVWIENCKTKDLRFDGIRVCARQLTFEGATTLSYINLVNARLDLLGYRTLGNPRAFVMSGNSVALAYGGVIECNATPQADTPALTTLAGYVTDTAVVRPYLEASFVSPIATNYYTLMIKEFRPGSENTILSSSKKMMPLKTASGTAAIGCLLYISSV